MPIRFVFICIATFAATSIASADNPRELSGKHSPYTVAGSSPRDLFIGTWVPAKNQEKITIQFLKTGRVKVSFNANLVFEGTFRFVDNQTVELKMESGGQGRTSRAKFKVTRDELTIWETEANDRKESFKRVK